ncbi:M15 family metallopeptidase [Streptomyces sp. 549]|uniref:M15 family metallopeptidase n=1 Tax=Streptomyces sp. 549 TaxID=3049076 RepID=UPI0024C2E3D8|nr:M15 family metallopeptidase [Streptomyces sp. 549]MDK1474779.1 M15 family metallopeptidase [Streptomyces sp. 549]
MFAGRAVLCLLLPAVLLAGPEGPAPSGVRAAPEGRAAEPRAPAAFTALAEVAPSILSDMRYATARNFTGAPVVGYRDPVCLLTRDAARALRRAQARLLRTGHSLLVYDCYRPQRAVDHFVAWAADQRDQRTKAEFYPRVDKSALIAEGYVAERSGHSRGSTVDVTLVRWAAPLSHLGAGAGGCAGPGSGVALGCPVDMGTPYDFFDPLSHTLDPRIGGEQRANRLLLRRALEAVGFVNLPEEWWHFTLRPEAFPDRYFDFPVARSSVRGGGRGVR